MMDGLQTWDKESPMCYGLHEIDNSVFLCMCEVGFYWVRSYALSDWHI